MIKDFKLTFAGIAVSVIVVSLGILTYIDINRSDQLFMANSSTKELTSLTSVDVSTFRAFLIDKKPILIDVRTPEEFVAGHLSGAQNLDFYASDFATRLEQLDRNETYAIYCRSGNRSSQTLEIMGSLGFSSVLNLSGGVLAWEDVGGFVCTNTSC